MIRSGRSLVARIRRLSARVPPPPGPELADVAPEWRAVVARHPEARTRALALAEGCRQLWPDREPDAGEFIEDEECRLHYLYLEGLRYGSLDKMFADVLKDEACGPAGR